MQRFKKRIGFALVELVVVTLIISALSGATVAVGSKTVKNARVSRATSDLHNFSVSVEAMLGSTPKVASISSTAEIPEIAEKLNKFLSPDYQLSQLANTSDLPSNISMARSATSLIYASDKKDPWGNPYYAIFDYAERSGAGNSEFYVTILSAGPDSKASLGGKIDRDDLFLLTQYRNGAVKSAAVNADESTLVSLDTEAEKTVGIAIGKARYTSNSASDPSLPFPVFYPKRHSSIPVSEIPAEESSATVPCSHENIKWGEWKGINAAYHSRDGICRNEACESYGMVVFSQIGDHTDENDDGICDTCKYVIELRPPHMVTGSGWYNKTAAGMEKSQITSISFQRGPEAPKNYDACWDVTNKNLSPAKSVMAYIKGTDITIVGNGADTVMLDGSAQSMFRDYSALRTLDASTAFDTSNVSGMLSMFYCSGLTYLDASSWDTSNCTNMQTVFFGCSKLKKLDISGWDTAMVTNMSQMFRGCSSLEVIYVGTGWTTENATGTLSITFYGCKTDHVTLKE